MGFSTADEKTLLAEYRKSGLLPEDIEDLKRLADEKYVRALAYRYWAACAKLHNANKLLHGNCRCCIHWNALEQEKMPCRVCYYLVGADAQIDGWECVRDISEEANGLLEKYDCLIAVHRDTDNDHIHISLNSVRAGARAEREWMMRDGEGNVLPCEIKAGGKHQDSAELRRAMNDWLRDYTRTHGWEVKDNNAIAAKRRQERYEKRNEYLRHVLASVASQCRSTKELTRRLRAYGITLKRRGSTVSVLPPGGRRAVRLRTLGLEWADIEHLMALRRERERLAERQWWAYVRCVRRRWYETRREAYGHSHGALDSLLILVLFLLLGDVPKPQAAYSEPECLALFGSPDKAETEAFQGLAYAREQDLQTPQEIERKEAELRSAIRRARIDCDQSALEAALSEWRKLQMLQTSIRSIHCIL